jgi:hypothetical protein
MAKWWMCSKPGRWASSPGDTCNETDPPTYNKANVVFQNGKVSDVR